MISIPNKEGKIKKGFKTHCHLYRTKPGEGINNTVITIPNQVHMCIIKANKNSSIALQEWEIRNNTINANWKKRPHTQSLQQNKGRPAQFETMKICLSHEKNKN